MKIKTNNEQSLVSPIHQEQNHKHVFLNQSTLQKSLKRSLHTSINDDKYDNEFLEIDIINVHPSLKNTYSKSQIIDNKQLSQNADEYMQKEYLEHKYNNSDGLYIVNLNPKRYYLIIAGIVGTIKLQGDKFKQDNKSKDLIHKIANKSIKLCDIKDIFEYDDIDDMCWDLYIKPIKESPPNKIKYTKQLGKNLCTDSSVAKKDHNDQQNNTI